MEDTRQRAQTSGDIGKERKDRNLKHYVMIAFIVFVTFCCCILFFFMIYRHTGFAVFWKRLAGILQPVIVGVVLAYLLNPVMNFQEQRLMKIFAPRMKSMEKAKKISRGIAIAGSLLFLVGIFVLLIAAIVPSMITSIQGISASFPEEVNNLVRWVDEFTKGDTEAAAFVNDMIEKASAAWQNFVGKDLLPQAQRYIASITSGVIYGVKLIMNVLIGIIISVYVMAGKETFAGQAKKIIYALFKPVHANVIVQTVRKSHEIFGGFISGKILDSAIIGVLAYITLALLKMPDTVLLAVIIGVTNIIPFFGPFIGAVPAFIIVVLQNPVQGIYFLIFILVLQQIDGNIIGPKILGNSTGLSSFWVIFAILVFGGLWGFVGMLLGVPLMAVIYYIAQNVVAYYLRQRGLAVDTESYVHLTGVDRESNQLLYEEKPERKKKIIKRAKKADVTQQKK